MAKCANCGAMMSCTCQTRRSIGGKVGCSNCIGALNAADKKSGIVPKPPVKPATSTSVKNKAVNAPTVNKVELSNIKKPKT